MVNKKVCHKTYKHKHILLQCMWEYPIIAGDLEARAKLYGRLLVNNTAIYAVATCIKKQLTLDKGTKHALEESRELINGCLQWCYYTLKDPRYVEKKGLVQCGDDLTLLLPVIESFFPDREKIKSQDIVNFLNEIHTGLEGIITDKPPEEEKLKKIKNFLDKLHERYSSLITASEYYDDDDD